ncbi:type VI secretion system contractile sheath large subunit, partial [Vibrio alginolyticus]|nr:type VI secretion system contractile sheath large subunit [Vibrio alginolyticus]MDW2233938.1 type VI secretion system contractile sheath large subunit [Vibrio sp. 2091]
MTTQVEKQLDPTVGEQTTSFLEQAIGATKQTEASRAEELIKTLTEEAMKGTVSWNKNLTVTFREAINLLDRQISEQLSEVMHHPELQ